MERGNKLSPTATPIDTLVPEPEFTSCASSPFNRLFFPLPHCIISESSSLGTLHRCSWHFQPYNCGSPSVVRTRVLVGCRSDAAKSRLLQPHISQLAPASAASVFLDQWKSTKQPISIAKPKNPPQIKRVFACRTGPFSLATDPGFGSAASNKKQQSQST